MKAKDNKLLQSFTTNSPSDLVFWSFRYFLGRMTIATTSFAQELAVAWPHLDPKVQKLIMNELETEFLRDDNARQDLQEKGKDSIYSTFLPLGQNCDRDAWQLVRNAYKSKY